MMYCVMNVVVYIILSHSNSPFLGEWTTPSNVGECMPPTSQFVIENITKNRAIIYGGLINDVNDVTSTVYIIDIRKKAIVSYD